eukprot:c13048_g1_i1.p1 GENE.c13048_g1_i1~~c13048_g1_i1.p1  ORF type:complete len:259 (+),score=32.39 c13048_g1_i1:168-944(+)
MAGIDERMRALRQRGIAFGVTDGAPLPPTTPRAMMPQQPTASELSLRGRLHAAATESKRRCSVLEATPGASVVDIVTEALNALRYYLAALSATSVFDQMFQHGVVRFASFVAGMAMRLRQSQAALPQPQPQHDLMLRRTMTVVLWVCAAVGSLVPTNNPMAYLKAVTAMLEPVPTAPLAPDLVEMQQLIRATMLHGAKARSRLLMALTSTRPNERAWFPTTISSNDMPGSPQEISAVFTQTLQSLFRELGMEMQPLTE